LRFVVVQEGVSSVRPLSPTVFVPSKPGNDWRITLASAFSASKPPPNGKPRSWYCVCMPENGFT
jgi:hypothetical protein